MQDSLDESPAFENPRREEVSSPCVDSWPCCGSPGPGNCWPCHCMCSCLPRHRVHSNLRCTLSASYLKCHRCPGQQQARPTRLIAQVPSRELQRGEPGCVTGGSDTAILKGMRTWGSAFDEANECGESGPLEGHCALQVFVPWIV